MQTAICVLDGLRAARFLPHEINLLEVLVETKLVAISAAHLWLTDELLKNLC